MPKRTARRTPSPRASSSAKQAVGLIAEGKTSTQSARTQSALDNRSHRKARTARLPEKVPPAAQQGDCRLGRGGSDLAPERCPHGSRAVRALSGVTVLYPFLHGHDYQNLMLP